MDDVTKHLDVSGTCCPIPIIRLTQMLRGMQPGERVSVTGNDPLLETSIRDFCQARGHILESVTPKQNRDVTLLIRIGK